MDTTIEKKSGVTFHLWNQSLWQGQNVSLNLFSAIVSHSELFKWAMVDICIYTYIYTPAVWHNLKGSYGLFEKQVPVEFLHLWPMGEHLSCIYAKFSCPCFAYLEIWMVSRSPKFPVCSMVTEPTPLLSCPPICEIHLFCCIVGSLP